LSTADDLCVAFHIAVSGSKINWRSAESVLERYLFLLNEDYCYRDGTGVLVKYVWSENVWKSIWFKVDIVTLLKGGDCWRVSKSLDLLAEIVCDDYDHRLKVTAEFFNSLASIFLQLPPFSVEEELKWAFFIAKNNEKTVDPGI
jgi:hypothetical protein